MENTMQWISYPICLLISGYALYVTATTVLKYVDYSKKKKEFRATNPKEMEQVSDALQWIGIYCLAIVAIVVGIVVEINGQKNIYTFTAYLFFLIYFIGFMFEVLMRRTILFDANGFFYNNEYSKFKSVVSINQKKGMGFNYELRLSSKEKSLSIPKKYALLIKERTKKGKNKNKR